VTEPDRPFRRLSPLTPVVRSAIFVVAVAAASWDQVLSGGLGPLGMLLLAVLGAGAIYGYASWLRTRYWIEDDELRIDTGVIYHQSRRIRIDRLQGIDIVQPFVARLFGLAELKMDVAGGDREGSLAFMPLAEAHQLRETLLARRDAVRRARLPEPADGTEGATTSQPDWAPPDRDIAVLDLPTLLQSMLLSWETVGLVVGGLVFAAAMALNGVVVVAPALPVFAGYGILQVRKLSAYYGFTVSQTRVGLQVRRGLLERSTQTIALARVQGVVVSEPLLWRRMGWAKLDVSIAGYGGGTETEGGPSSTTVMPVAPRPLVMELARHLLRGDDQGDPEVDPDGLLMTQPPRQARWLDPVSRRFMWAGVGQDLIASREGLLTRRTHVARHARVQSLRLSQGPVQRRLGLADLHVDSPPGPVQVRARHRPVAEARALLEQEGALARAARLAAG
jgi:putative membrane protein